MKTAQFYRGKLEGIQKRFESANLTEILPEEKLNELRDYADLGEYPRFFRQEKVISKTIIAPAQNTDGRRGGITNHTVLYQFDQALMHETVKYIFDLDTFVSEILSGKRRFKMPPTPSYPIDKDEAFIEPPAPIEWEVQK